MRLPERTALDDLTRIITICRFSDHIPHLLREALELTLISRTISRTDLLAAVEALCQAVFREQEESA